MSRGPTRAGTLLLGAVLAAPGGLTAVPATTPPLAAAAKSAAVQAGAVQAGAAQAGAAMAVSAAPPRFELRQRWNVGGAGGWDYLALDAAGRRLFVSRATRVDVIDTASGAVIGSVAGTLGVHGIALAPDLGRGFTSNGQADSVTVFDLQTLAVIREVKLSAHNPDAILYEPTGKHLFTFNGRSKDVTVLDAVTLSTAATIPAPGKPEFAVDGGTGRIYANIESDPGQMLVIDSRTPKAEAIWPLPGCSSPSGLAMDRANHRLFSVCDAGTLVITDALTGKQVARMPIGEGPDAAAYDPRRRLVFSSNGDGTLTVIRQESADRYEVAATVPTQRGARTMALDSANGKIYLVSAQFGQTPPATQEHPRPRPPPVDGSFAVIVIGISDSRMTP